AAMFRNTIGADNLAMGSGALFSNTTGNGNVAGGDNAVGNNTTGNFNIGLGATSLSANTTGSYNIGIGYQGGANLSTGSSNIDIGNAGVAGESSTIRIGNANQKATYIAGISGSVVSGADVVVSGVGRLGVVASSARYKKDIADMGSSTENLLKLRPVTFKYRNDERGTTQYGLIAEEVEKVY